MDNPQAARGSPVWYKAILFVEALNWLGLAGFLVVLSLMAAAQTDRLPMAALVAFMAFAAFVAVVVLVVGAVRRSSRPLPARFGAVHSVIGLMAALPFTATYVYGSFREAAEGRAGGGLWLIPFVLIGLAIPVVGLLLSRNSRQGAQWAGLALGLISCLGGGAISAVLALMFGLAPA